MPFEIFKKHDADEYNNGVLLNEYAGSYYLVAAQRGKDGSVYKRWAHPSGRDKKPREKALPWQVKLGDSLEEAADTLKWALKELGAQGGEDVPF